MANTTPLNPGYQIINGASRGINAEYVDCWLEWKLLEQDIAGNCSRVHVLLYARATAALSTVWTAAEKFGYVGYDDDHRQYKETTYDFSGMQINCFGEHTFTIRHAQDGSCKVKLQGMWATTHSQYISGGSAAGEVTLPAIARQSTVKATDANVGAVSQVSVLRHDEAYTHSIAWSFGSLSGYLTAGGEVTQQPVRFAALSVPFTVPESFYTQLTHAPWAVCTLTCRTYRGDDPLGESAECTFRVTADPRLCAPVVTGSVEDVNEQTLALTGDSRVLVRYMSDGKCTIRAQAQNGATLEVCSIGGQTLTDTDHLVLSRTQWPAVEFAATDSRGYRTSFVAEVPMVSYVKLSCVCSVQRTDPTSGNALLSGKGSWFSGSFGARDNHLAVSVSADGGEFMPVETEQTGEGYRFSLVLSGLDYRSSHSICLRVQDALDTVEQTLFLGKGIPVFDWDEEDFAFHVPVSMPGLALGDLYLTATDEDPAQLLGGIWQRADAEALRLWKRMN